MSLKVGEEISECVSVGFIVSIRVVFKIIFQHGFQRISRKSLSDVRNITTDDESGGCSYIITTCCEDIVRNALE